MLLTHQLRRVGQDFKRIVVETTSQRASVEAHGRATAQDEVFLSLVRGIGRGHTLDSVTSIDTHDGTSRPTH